MQLIENIKHFRQDLVLKLLFDNNISHRVVTKISDIYPHSSHVMILNLDEATDLKVWQYAKQNNFTIVTKDSDFNDLALYKGIPPKIIWMKLGNCRVDDIVTILKDNVNIINDFLNDKTLAILEI